MSGRAIVRRMARTARTLVAAGALASLCALGLAPAPAAAATYLNRSTPFSWVAPAGHARVAWTSGASCSSGYVGAAIDDDISAQLPLGFTFTFGGVDYTQVQVMSNGRLQFNNGYCGYGTQSVGPPPTYPYPYPNASVVRTLRVYGTDLDPTPSGAAGACPTATCYVSYATEGTAPNRRFIVTWVNVPEWGASSRTGSFNLQVVLEEATQEFVYQFGTSNHPTGGSAQIGWQLTTTDYDVWSTPVVPPPNSAVRFYLPAPVAEFRLDETSWSGAGSLNNSTGGGSDGSPVGTTQPVPAGRVCGGGNIPSNTSTAAIDALDTGYDVDSEIGSSGSATFWYRSNGAWSGGGSKAAQLFDASVANNRWFYLVRQNGNGRLSFNLTDNANNDFQATTGNLSYAAGQWVHVGVTWQLTPIAANNRLQIFVNGALARTQAIGTTQPLTTALGSLYFGDNRSAFTTNPGTGNSADGVIDEIRLYNSEVPNAVILRDYNATRSCVPVSATPAGFNAFESATPAASVNGVIKTNVAASPFGVDVVAVRTGGTAVETAFTGDVRVELVNAAGGGACTAYPTIRSLGTLNFASTDQGRKTLAGISEPNAWPNARVRVSYPATGTPTVVGCSTDPFAIRPASLAAVAVSDQDSATSGTPRALYNTAATGGIVHRAGRPFRIAATAQNAAGNATGNYAGAPDATLTACVLPAAGCVAGTLTAGAWTAAGGTVVAAGATYSEVGAFGMKLVDSTFAAVDAADGSTAAERNIESVTFNVGRFVPDHFVLTPASTPVFRTFDDTTCAARSFTYIGQPFGYVTLPRAGIEARNAAGGVTRNYAGALWKLVGEIDNMTYTPASPTLDTGLVDVPVIAGTGNGTGTVTANAADKLAYQRTTPVNQFNADIDLVISVSDKSEEGVLDNGTITTTTPALFANIAFDAGSLMRFGRLAVSNAQGSELLALPVPVETQYWNVNGFTRNVDDSCTQLAAVNVAQSNWQRALNACETSVTFGGRFNLGRGALRLTAPGQNNTGSVDLTVKLDGGPGGGTCVGGAGAAVTGANQSWLQIKGNTAAYNQNPAARASFGLLRGSRSLIYMRELY